MELGAEKIICGARSQPQQQQQQQQHSLSYQQRKQPQEQEQEQQQLLVQQQACGEASDFQHPLLPIAPVQAELEAEPVQQHLELRNRQGKGEH
jgi:transcription initiation factor TFIID subunit TAF12